MRPGDVVAAVVTLVLVWWWPVPWSVWWVLVVVTLVVSLVVTYRAAWQEERATRAERWLFPAVWSAAHAVVWPWGLWTAWTVEQVRRGRAAGPRAGAEKVCDTTWPEGVVSHTTAGPPAHTRRSPMITSTDIRQQVNTVIDAQAELGDTIDRAGIVRDVIDTYGLIDLDTIDHDDFWVIVARHDSTQA